MAVADPLLAIITPARNEQDNVPRLVHSMVSQERAPDFWIFVNDGSTDETETVFLREIAKYPRFQRRCHVELFKRDSELSGYALGKKYASVVASGLEALRKIEIRFGKRAEYVGLLDCDAFPEHSYYESLLEQFRLQPRLGIASAGVAREEFNDGRSETSIANRTHALGPVRIWRRSCLDDTGYHITISQDAVSEARAKMMGWRVESFPALAVHMRKRGLMVGYDYYGRSAFVRGVPYWYVRLGALRMCLQRRGKDARDYLYGYRLAKESGEPRIDDPLALKYYKNIFYYRLRGI